MRPRLLILGALALVVAAVVGLSLASRRRPPLGPVDGHLRPCPDSPNCVGSEGTTGRHAIEPLRVIGDPDEAFARLVGLADAMPRTRLVTHGDDYAHLEVTSRLLRFVDDLELRLDRATRRIHVRSASRVGRSDLGVNRARVEALRAAYEEEP